MASGRVEAVETEAQGSVTRVCEAVEAVVVKMSAVSSSDDASEDMESRGLKLVSVVASAAGGGG